MNTRLLKYAGMIIALIVLTITNGCGGEEETLTRDKKAISVKGMVAVASSEELNKNFTGTLEGLYQTVITAKISEAVKKIIFREGDLVVSNNVLMSLDKVGPASNYVQVYAIYKNAEKNYNKMKYLFVEGAVSESQFDGAKTEYEVAQANFSAAEKLVDIRTPIGGTVTSIDVSVGDYVIPGQKVAMVANVSKLRMNLGISASDISYFNVGDEVSVTVAAGEELRGSGKVAAVARSADPETRTFQVEIKIENSDNLLKPGMFAEAKITVEKFENIIVVPRVAAVSRGNRDYVFVLNGDRVVLREVVLGAEFNGSIEIKQGLNIGDTLVTVGQDYLDDGFLVNLVELTGADGKETTL